MITTFDLYLKTTFSKTTYDFLYSIEVLDISFAFVFSDNNIIKSINKKEPFEKTINKMYDNFVDIQIIENAKLKYQISKKHKILAPSRLLIVDRQIIMKKTNY